MNMNINTDNYEAYLLDYMEGNLSPDEAEQLKAFIAAQGLNWDELTEELPHLEAPTITYEGKESLKKKAAVVPLYVKIASAAAAAGLLLTVTLWHEKQLPDVEPIAELKPILPTRLITSEKSQALPPRTVSFMTAQTKTAQTKVKRQPTTVRTETALLADLQPMKAEGTPIALTASQAYEPDFDLIAYQMNSNLAFAQYDENDFEEYEEDERDLSLIGRGIYRLTDGRHDSFASIILSGLHTAKEEVNLAATDFALTAYYRADERFEEAKEQWQEKREE
ncbi:MAG: hypothetical protein IKX35_02270 [Bacteroidales bacterium]|nr:hypothetical protein [Bacteroidales bacterium]